LTVVAAAAATTASASAENQKTRPMTSGRGRPQQRRTIIILDSVVVVSESRRYTRVHTYICVCVYIYIYIIVRSTIIVRPVLCFYVGIICLYWRACVYNIMKRSLGMGKRKHYTRGERHDETKTGERPFGIIDVRVLLIGN